VFLNQLALSSVERYADIFVQGENLGTNSLHASPRDRDPTITKIRATTAETYCRTHEIETVHLFKSDTEGHDLDVMLGSSTLLKEGKIWVFQFEYNHRWVYSRHFLKDVFDFTESLPYNVGKLTPEGLEIFERWDPELERFFEGNYVLIRQDVMPMFTHRMVTLDAHNTYA
jgi:hypothetical protein